MTRLPIFICILLFGVWNLSKAQDTTQVQPATENPFNLDGSPSRGVYGSDDRINVTRAEGYEVFGKATLVMIDKDDIHKRGYIETETLKQYLKNNEVFLGVVNPFIRFEAEPTCGYCTGFLIAPDMMVTAGHCVNDSTDCADWVWLLDYTDEMQFEASSGRLYFDQRQLLRCEDILSYELSDSGDYSVIRLNKKLDRAPYRFRVSGKIAQGQDVYMIGSPTGLPLKFVDHAKVLINDEKSIFETNLDAFSGNSGGPVFDVRGWIEGILVAGAEDYKQNRITRVLNIAKYDQYDWATEDVQRITGIPTQILVEAIYSNIAYAIEIRDHQRLKDWLIYSGIADHPYVQEKGGLEQLAIAVNDLEALKLITAAHTKFSKGLQYGGEMMRYAIEQRHNSYLTELLSDGYNPNYTDSLGETPIVWAVQSSNTEAVEMLIGRGGSIDVQFGEHEDTFLHRAVRKGDLALLEQVLRWGADPEIENAYGSTACELAKRYGNRAMKKRLKKAEKTFKKSR